MPDRSSTPFDVAELERRLLAVDSAVVLTPPRVLRRIIKHDCKLPGLGLQVPHRKTYVIDRDKALAIASRDELGLQAERVLPEALILIAKRFAGIEAQQAAMTAVDRLGFHLRLKTQDGMKGIRIAFLREVSDTSQTREVFVEMVEQARQG